MRRSIIKPLILASLITVMLCCLVGCNIHVNSSTNDTEVEDYSNCYTLIEITKCGETHQFIIYSDDKDSPTHWPGCKYCIMESDSLLQNPEGNPSDEEGWQPDWDCPD